MLDRVGARGSDGDMVTVKDHLLSKALNDDLSSKVDDRINERDKQ